MKEKSDEQPEISKPKHPTEHLAPYQFKKGQSGNPLGRPVGTISLKEKAKQMIQSMTDAEIQEYFNGMDKKVIWEMAEGKAQADVTSGGQPINMTVINYGDNDTPSVSS